VLTNTEHKYTIPEWFAKKEYKNAVDVLTYLADQYYIYGEHRQWLTSEWTLPLRSAVYRDAMKFEEYYENPEMRDFYERHNRSPWHGTERVLEKIFADVSEYSCYQVDERNDEVYEQFLRAIYESWKRAKKQNFKRKLNGKDEFTW